MTILSKKQMTEEDIKFQYITPALQAKWGSNRITMETKITDGKINLRGNVVVREKPKKADYVRYINATVITEHETMTGHKQYDTTIDCPYCANNYVIQNPASRNWDIIKVSD